MLLYFATVQYLYQQTNDVPFQIITKSNENHILKHYLVVSLSFHYYQQLISSLPLNILYIIYTRMMEKFAVK